MQTESHFESLSVDPFSLQENFINNKFVPEINFYQNTDPNDETD